MVSSCCASIGRCLTSGGQQNKRFLLKFSSHHHLYQWTMQDTTKTQVDTDDVEKRNMYLSSVYTVRGMYAVSFAAIVSLRVVDNHHTPSCRFFER